MRLKPIIFIAVGFGLYALSRSLELRGDLAPLAQGGASPGRLHYHLMALAVLLAGLGSFISAGIGTFRALRDR